MCLSTLCTTKAHRVTEKNLKYDNFMRSCDNILVRYCDKFMRSCNNFTKSHNNFTRSHNNCKCLSLAKLL